MSTTPPTDESLVQRSLEGDPDAFVALLRRHAAPVRALIGRLINDPTDAEDVLQETVLQAWLTLGQLRAPAQVRAWLVQVARNRCRDHFKRHGRQPEPVPAGDLEGPLNRAGRAAGAGVSVALEALAAVPPLLQETARLHYLGGLSVAEIARGLGCPVGTIKRRLHSAREQLRAHCGVPPREQPTMSLFLLNGHPQPFPERRPEFTVVPRPGPVPAVDWAEFRNYFSRVEPGDHTLWAMYEPPDWRLYCVYDQRVGRAVSVHGLTGREVASVRAEEEGQWQPTPGLSVFVRLDEARGQILGTQRLEGDTLVLRTFLDEGFAEDWWGWARRQQDTGRFTVQADGSLTQRHPPDDAEDNTGVVGRCLLTVGTREFECVRLLQVPGTPTDSDLLMESFVRLDGRLLLDRRYNARYWGHARSQAFRDRGPWDEYLPEAEKLVVDGVTFTHWYDCFGQVALGLTAD